ncbi:MAG: class I SAM-dependent methyltransferase [Chloroflexi bacterium]|nr:class I SAM-dependent methyltransferase [Chloroflexota bacterium]
MDEQTAAFLVNLNQHFYEAFGPAFAATRRRIQNGVRRALLAIPDEGSWVDLGCGSGSVAAAWLEMGRKSRYTGLDFSESLLASAEQAVAEAAQAVFGDGANARAQVTFKQANLFDPDWVSGLEGPFTGALAFAVLHHIPSTALRERILLQVNRLLLPGGRFVHSEWQFQHSPKLMARRLPWPAVNLRDDQLEPGDTLLDWRYAPEGAPEQVGLRYVHLFTREELADLARATGFRIVDEYESDGQGGRLGLYQVWEKVTSSAPPDRA